MHACLGRLNGITLVVNRRCGTGKIINLVDLDIERKRHIMTHDLEPGIFEQMRNIVFNTSEVVIDTKDVITFVQQPFAEVRADKPGTSGDQNFFRNRH